MKNLDESTLFYIADQLSNSMEFYTEEEFISHISSETNLTPTEVQKIWNGYYDLSVVERMNLGWNIEDTYEQITDWVNS